MTSLKLSSNIERQFKRLVDDTISTTFGRKEVVGSDGGSHMSVADAQATTSKHLVQLACQKLSECNEAQRPRKGKALIAFLGRALGIKSGRFHSFVLDPEEVMQMALSQGLLPPTSSKADKASFGSIKHSDLPVCRGVSWLLEQVCGEEAPQKVLTRAEAKEDRRRLRLQELVAELKVATPRVMPLASDPEAEARIARQLQELPSNFSERALARWIISQSFSRVSCDASSIAQRLYDSGVVQEAEDGRLTYKFIATVEERESSARTEVKQDSQVVQSGSRSPRLLKRVRTKWTINVVPTYSANFLSDCRYGDNSFGTAARLRGRPAIKETLDGGFNCRMAASNEKHSHKRNHEPPCDGDVVFEKSRVNREDSHVRRDRQKHRRQDRDLKRKC
jgi:hypothetical protein